MSEPLQQYVKVAMPLPLHTYFDYALNAEQSQHVVVGGRVVVPFGKRQVLGIVVDISKNSALEATKIKNVLECLDNEPLFDTKLLKLAKWLAQFYIAPIGEVFATMLPSALNKGANAAPAAIQYLRSKQAFEHTQDIEQLLVRSKQQSSLYNQLSGHDLRLSQVKSEFSNAVIKGLQEKNLIEMIEKPEPTGQWQQQIVLGSKQRPNPEQAIAIASINQASQFTVFLIEGVTGSGKTEVYLQVIEEKLLLGKQVLLLVPEIGLTPQTVKRFQRRFGDVVAVWHSGLTDLERLKVWQKAKHNQLGIVIGTRSAIFMPFADLGMIIVDEEHDESFKQQDGLRYHARDVAAFRAKQHDVSLVLGSASPALETLHNALNQKYRHLQLLQRAGGAAMPVMKLMDLTGLPLQSGIAPAMLVRIEQTLKNGEQVLIFVNRRGYAPALICTECGHVETCIDCDTSFTVHLTTNNLQCHRCGQSQAYHPHSFKTKCSVCSSQSVTTQGVGTEQIQAFLTEKFPSYSCVRIDSDSTRGKRKLNTLFDEINQQKHQLLVGTQIVAKGHHFENVTLALILNVDSYLFSSDFKAPEKLAQLVTQFSGRAGRASKPGEVWLQSYQVSNPLLQDLVNNGYSQFARTLLQERVAANLPPISWQACLRVEHIDQKTALAFLVFANSLFSQFKHLRYFGPFPAGVEKKQTRYRFLSVAQADSNQYLNKALQQVRENLAKHSLSAKVRWAIDIMPADFS